MYWSIYFYLVQYWWQRHPGGTSLHLSSVKKIIWQLPDWRDWKNFPRQGRKSWRDRKNGNVINNSFFPLFFSKKSCKRRLHWERIAKTSLRSGKKNNSPAFDNIFIECGIKQIFLLILHSVEVFIRNSFKVPFIFPRPQKNWR